MSSAAIEHVFTATAATYDEDRARLMPGFHDLYAWAINLIPEGAQKIVDLGAGTGLLSVRVRERFPEAELHLIDISEAMLAQARERMKGDARVSFEAADYTVAPLPQQVDAFVSALSIHHIPHEAKRELFRRAVEALRPGGVFVNAEHIAGPTPELEERYKAFWLDQVKALGATERQIADSRFRSEQDRCASVEDQLAWMREAGLADVDCWYKNGRFAVMAGTKR